jgi:mRNA interferase MazF
MVNESHILNRGDIWLAQFDDVITDNPSHTRLCVVVSPDEMHNHLRTVMVAPMTTRTQAAPFRVAVSFEGKTGLILLDQIRSLDKTRLMLKKGTVNENVLNDTLKVLQELFA